MMQDDAHAVDMDVFHQLFNHRSEISREVVNRLDGVDTVTQSKNPEVARLLQTHVISMLARVEERRPIHRRDPLFAELFRHAERIEARYEVTDTGVRVTETSRDPYVVRLIQAHSVTFEFCVDSPEAWVIAEALVKRWMPPPARRRRSSWALGKIAQTAGTIPAFCRWRL